MYNVQPAIKTKFHNRTIRLGQPDTCGGGGKIANPVSLNPDPTQSLPGHEIPFPLQHDFDDNEFGYHQMNQCESIQRCIRSSGHPAKREIRVHKTRFFYLFFFKPLQLRTDLRYVFIHSVCVIVCVTRNPCLQSTFARSCGKASSSLHPDPDPQSSQPKALAPVAYFFKFIFFFFFFFLMHMKRYGGRVSPVEIQCVWLETTHHHVFHPGSLLKK